MIFRFELTDAEVEVVSRALGRQPYDEVAAVVIKMQSQIIVQNTAKREAEATQIRKSRKKNGATASVSA